MSKFIGSTALAAVRDWVKGLFAGFTLHAAQESESINPLVIGVKSVSTTNLSQEMQRYTMYNFGTLSGTDTIEPTLQAYNDSIYSEYLFTFTCTDACGITLPTGVDWASNSAAPSEAGTYQVNISGGIAVIVNK